MGVVPSNVISFAKYVDFCVNKKIKKLSIHAIMFSILNIMLVCWRILFFDYSDIAIGQDKNIKLM